MDLLFLHWNNRHFKWNMKLEPRNTKIHTLIRSHANSKHSFPSPAVLTTNTISTLPGKKSQHSRDGDTVKADDLPNHHKPSRADEELHSNIINARVPASSNITPRFKFVPFLISALLCFTWANCDGEVVLILVKCAEQICILVHPVPSGLY